MSTDDAPARPPKRARCSPEQDISTQPSTSSSALYLANLDRHPEFWFDDGNIILITPKYMGFRIFRGLLAAQSTVFADMFASSTPIADETFDACPVVQLTDSHHDLVHLLRVLLPTTPIRYHTESKPEFVRSFDELYAVIRLAHKYHIPSIQEQALSALQAYYFTSDFNDYFGPPQTHVSIHKIHCIGGVNLARLTDTPLMLPSALHACCRMDGRLLDGWTHEDGTVEYLSTDDVRRCFDARGTLSRELALLPSRLFAPVPPNRCTEYGRCALFMVTLAGNTTLVEKLMKKDVLTDRSKFIRRFRPDNSLCEGCTQVLLERDRLNRKRIWDSLPQILGIVVEGWVKPDGGDMQI